MRGAELEAAFEHFAETLVTVLGETLARYGGTLAQGAWT